MTQRHQMNIFELLHITIAIACGLLLARIARSNNFFAELFLCVIGYLAFMFMTGNLIIWILEFQERSNEIHKKE
jgi:hypothetical protein